jgi:hypothetical protein
VQPLLLDLTWLEARRQSAAESSSSSGSEAGGQAETEGLEPHAGAQGPGQSHPQSSPGMAASGPGGRFRPHVYGRHGRTLTPDSCQASISASSLGSGELGQQGDNSASTGGEDVMVSGQPAT